ncbi:phage tail protein [Aliikangiella sp. IMCC44359]|uniref:phage tail protein n=1 Tax=Aliikangiella sp. IMCC44359 TaxID=3459125 RepID=UPI00403AF2BD
MSDEYYPPGAFYFTVTVLGSATPLAMLTEIDASFEEVTGIQSQFDVEEEVEGGENRFVHRLPKAAKYSNLVLKRGVVTKDSFLAEWVGETIGANLSLPIIPQNLLVSLLSNDGYPSIAWLFVNAYPLRWEVSAMNAQQNQLLTENLEFSYNYFERFNLGSGLSAAVKLAKVAAKFI